MHGYRIKEARFWYLVKVVIKCVVSNQRMWSKENPFFRGSFLRLSAKEFSAWFYRSNGVLFWTHWAAITFESSWLFWMPWISHHKSEYTFMTEWISLVGIRIVFFIVFIYMWRKWNRHRHRTWNWEEFFFGDVLDTRKSYAQTKSRNSAVATMIKDIDIRYISEMKWSFFYSFL